MAEFEFIRYFRLVIDFSKFNDVSIKNNRYYTGLFKHSMASNYNFKAKCSMW